MKGKLYLIPSLLGEENPGKVIPGMNIEIIRGIRFFIVENVRTTRRFLASLGIREIIDESTFFLMDKHTSKEQYPSFLKPLLEGYDLGIISEAGLPCIADPGSEIVMMAHEKNFKVIPLVGPNSMILALMASGLDGQQFAFHGYLPVKSQERIRKIREMENESKRKGISIIFMETPYRNMALLNDLLNTCHNNTNLCIAADITLESEMISTKTIHNWKDQKDLPDLNKRPAIFIMNLKES